MAFSDSLKPIYNRLVILAIIPRQLVHAPMAAADGTMDHSDLEQIQEDFEGDLGTYSHGQLSSKSSKREIKFFFKIVNRTTKFWLL